MEDTRQKILNTAGAQFADKGYKGTTIREICRKAGVNVASVNYYFGDKETLYREVVAAANPAEVAQEPEFPAEMPPEERLRALIFGFLTHVRSLPSDSWHLRLIMRELTNPTPGCRDAIRAVFQKRFEEVRSVFRELLPAAPEYFISRMAFGIFGQCIVYRRDGVPRLVLESADLDRHFGTQQLANHILTTTLASVGLADPIKWPIESPIERESADDHVEQTVCIENGAWEGDAAR